MKQREAVYSAIVSVLGVASVQFEDGMNVAPHMTKERRAQVNTILFEGFRAGRIDLSKTFSDEELREYVSGLQSNWIRKDPRLNGNTKYEPKNPGSRAGQGDEQLKNLKLYLATKTDPADRAEVQVFIDARVAELAASKAKSVQVNTSALPAALREKFGIAE